MLVFSWINPQQTITGLNSNRNRVLFLLKSECNFSPQHLLFLSVCLSLKSNVDISQITESCQYGGLVGYGKAEYLNSMLGRSKVFRTHAAFHDAAGHMKKHFNIGPGYAYVLGHLPNHFLVGHFMGLLYWLYIKVRYPRIFDEIHV